MVSKVFEKLLNNRLVDQLDSQCLTVLGMLVLFRNSYGISRQIYGFILSFSATDSFGWFWMGSVHTNIELMLKFLKVPFLVLHFFCRILLSFLMILSVILLSMLMILLSTLSVIRDLISGNT